MTDIFPATHSRRVAITGVGLVTPLGATRTETWQGILAGRRAVSWLDSDSTFPPVPSAQRAFGGRVPWQHPGPDRMVSFARKAASEAVSHAGLSSEMLRNAACVIGTSKIDLEHFDHQKRKGDDVGQEDSPFDFLFPSAAAAAVARDLHCEAGIICPVAACATGLVSVIQAANLIRDGLCPVAIAGSTDASLHPGLLASYRRLGVLAKPGAHPAGACRPFDRQRSGFAVGEGAGMLVLEDWDHATARKAPILAEWVDGILRSDPAGLTRIDQAGTVVAKTIQDLLKRCSLSAADVDSVSLHATATVLNDEAEGRALQQVFNQRTESVPAFGIKGAIGHLMGAAGAVETAICVLSLAEQKLPPTVNHQDPEEEMTGVLKFGQRSASIPQQHLLKVSLGFGGTIAAGILKRPAE
ncbi:beta-ketoacyl-[acyl-carrier-protein] synthase family protein [Planctomicrobium sp. SH661]|uniref:beta-ketoacyl-[acyl-carrier-protein] synthase family protein n=1 Tax=Planctomicrobium sp. SH661 TaxID=3448124 RepID=UPI003F5BFE08